MFKNPFSFKGRIRRTEYWISVIIAGIASSTSIIEFMLSPDSVALLIFVIVLNVGVVWFSLAQGAKRCHDRGNSGWYQIIPFYGLWMLFGGSIQDNADYSEHDYVDLGLSVMWATCNVGAESPSDYGNYYAWGETKTKSEYTEDNSVTLYKQMGSIAGNPQYDAATANWGGDWRMPTAEEIDELIAKCTRERVELNGHEGYKVTGPNGNSIFLPAAGLRDGLTPDHVGERGSYWGATSDGDVTLFASFLDFSDFNEGGGTWSWIYRFHGFPVRPVLNKPKSTSSQTDAKTQTSSSTASSSLKSISLPTGHINGYGYVDLGLSVKWATCNVGADFPDLYGNYYAWGETTTKSEYTEDNSVTYGKEMGSIAGNPQYDAATANWGEKWRMPTVVEIDELVDKCTWEWAKMSGHEGFKITGPNGKSIFLPYAGWYRGPSLELVDHCGQYWGATDGGVADSAHGLYIGMGCFYYRDLFDRYLGQPIRPVTD